MTVTPSRGALDSLGVFLRTIQSPTCVIHELPPYLPLRDIVDWFTRLKLELAGLAHADGGRVSFTILRFRVGMPTVSYRPEHR